MTPGSVSYARIADRYEQARGGAVRAEELATALAPWIGDGLLCDVGAGTGVVSDRLRRPGVDVVACDLSFEMISRAATRLPGRLFAGDAMALPLRDSSVDTITAVWVLHHVGDLAAALGECRRVLRPGGRVVSISGMSDPGEDDISPIVERLSDRLRPERRRQSLAVAETGRAVGYDLEHEGRATTTGSLSPADVADQYEQRLFAPVWDLSEDRWREVVEPALDELRSLPDPTVPRRRTFRHPLVVLRNA